MDFKAELGQKATSQHLNISIQPLFQNVKVSNTVCQDMAIEEAAKIPRVSPEELQSSLAKVGNY